MASRAAEPINREVLLGYLTQHRMLRRLNQAELERLIASAKPRTLAARARLFATGDAANAVYVVLSGWVKLSRGAPNGRDLVLELAGEGSVFGELGVIGGLPRGADATALAATRVLAIEGQTLLSILRANPEALLEMTKILCERLARANTQLEDTLFLPAEARLARALIRLAALDAKPQGKGLQIDLGLSQKEIGEITGLSRESTNRQLALWRDSGLLCLGDRTLTLLDSKAINDIAAGI